MKQGQNEISAERKYSAFFQAVQHAEKSAGGRSRTYLDTSHTTVSLVNGHLAKALVSVSGSDSLDVLNLLGDELGHSVLEGLSMRSIGAGKRPGERRSDLELVVVSTKGIPMFK